MIPGAMHHMSVANAQGGGADLTMSFVGHAYSRSTSNVTTMTFDSPSATILAGDLIIFTGMWDVGNGSSGSATVGGVAATAITNTYGTSEFPEGASYYFIATSTNPTIIVTTDDNDTCAGAAMVFRPTRDINTVTIGEAQASDGSNALNDTIVAESPALVPTGESYINGYFLTGRPGPGTIQNPTPSFTAGGWTHVDGDGNRSGNDDMDYAYKIIDAGETDVSEQATTTDAGRQCQHLFCLKIT